MSPAIAQVADEAPIHGLLPAVHEGAEKLGRDAVEQVRSDRDDRIDAQRENQQRRHERTAADARDAHHRADDEPDRDNRQIHGLACLHERRFAQMIEADTVRVVAERFSGRALRLPKREERPQRRDERTGLDG